MECYFQRLVIWKQLTCETFIRITHNDTLTNGNYIYIHNGTWRYKYQQSWEFNMEIIDKI